MERLTSRYPSGLIAVPQGMAPEALERLAAYEDTGVVPAKLSEIQNEAYDLGYQSCLNYKGLKWPEAEELQRYRETGMKPEEISARRDLPAAVDAALEAKANHIRDLLQAERDGRLVVLDRPMRPLIWGDDDHDTILCPNCERDLMGGFELDDSGETPMFQCPHCGQLIDSKKVMTREEAEAALVPDTNVGNTEGSSV